jgi:hypothetical protein
LLPDKVLGASNKIPADKIAGILLCIHTEMTRIPILHDVLFAFDAQFSRLARAGLAEVDEVLPVDDLRADEILFEVGVNDAGGLRGLGAGGD